LNRLEFLQNYIHDLRPYLSDPLVTEIMVNPVEEEAGRYTVFVERDAVMRRVDDVRVDTKSLMALATDIARTQLHREIDDQRPALSASLDDGSRIAMIIPPASCGGTVMTIRKFRPQRFTLDELIEQGAIPLVTANLLCGAIRERKNILISGANSSGKTTLLNALAAVAIPRDRRIVCIEDDVREIHLDNHPNKVHLQASANYSMAALVRDALRHRIQTVLIGEVIGEEGMALINALATGHSGSFATIHAENEALALDRLTACAMQAGQGLTYQAIRLRIAQSIHWVVQMENLRVVSVSRVERYDMAEDRFVLCGAFVAASAVATLAQ
jgi:pilus assembly protein CpaF